MNSLPNELHSEIASHISRSDGYLGSHLCRSFRQFLRNRFKRINESNAREIDWETTGLLELVVNRESFEKWWANNLTLLRIFLRENAGLANYQLVLFFVNRINSRSVMLRNSDTFLSAAFSGGDPRIIKLLLSYMTVDLQQGIEFVEACKKGDLTRAQELPSINLPGHYLNQALLQACHDGAIEVAKLAINKGAEEFVLAITIAVEKDDQHLLAVLLKKYELWKETCH